MSCSLSFNDLLMVLTNPENVKNSSDLESVFVLLPNTVLVSDYLDLKRKSLLLLPIFSVWSLTSVMMPSWKHRRR